MLRRKIRLPPAIPKTKRMRNKHLMLQFFVYFRSIVMLNLQILVSTLTANP